MKTLSDLAQAFANMNSATKSKHTLKNNTNSLTDSLKVYLER